MFKKIRSIQAGNYILKKKIDNKERKKPRMM